MGAKSFNVFNKTIGLMDSVLGKSFVQNMNRSSVSIWRRSGGASSLMKHAIGGGAIGAVGGGAYGGYNGDGILRGAARGAMLGAGIGAGARLGMGAYSSARHGYVGRMARTGYSSVADRIGQRVAAARAANAAAHVA